MYATPGAVLEDFHFVRRRILLEKLSIIGKFREAVGLDMVQGVRQSHLAKMMMMSVTLAIRRDVHQFRPIAFVRKTAHHALGELLAVVKQAFERYRFRNWSVVEEHGNFSFGRQPHEVRAGGINAFSAYIFPRTAPDPPNPARLSRSQNCELDAEFRKQIKCFNIHCRLWQPHSLGCPSKAMFEIP